MDVNFTPDANVSLADSVGFIKVIIIPIKIANTGAPITSNDTPANLSDPKKVATPAITVQITIPGIDFFVNFIFCLLILFQNIEILLDLIILIFYNKEKL